MCYSQLTTKEKGYKMRRFKIKIKEDTNASQKGITLTTSFAIAAVALGIISLALNSLIFFIIAVIIAIAPLGFKYFFIEKTEKPFDPKEQRRELDAKEELLLEEDKLQILNTQTPQ